MGEVAGHLLVPRPPLEKSRTELDREAACSRNWIDELDWEERYDFDEGGGAPYGAEFEEIDPDAHDPVMEAAEKEVL